MAATFSSLQPIRSAQGTQRGHSPRAVVAVVVLDFLNAAATFASQLQSVEAAGAEPPDAFSCSI